MSKYNILSIRRDNQYAGETYTIPIRANSQFTERGKPNFQTKGIVLSGDQFSLFEDALRKLTL